MPPRIALVTPSFNQAPFLEDALRSIHDQGYPSLEHVVIDGGSGDGSAAILERWGGRLAHWRSEPDGGQYDAINRGFARTTGEVMGWLNADDQHAPWTLALVGELFEAFPEVQWLTTQYPLIFDERGRAVQTGYGGGFNGASFRRGGNLPGRGWFATGFIQQESTFWRRSLWERAGGRLDASLRLAGDFELWHRFFAHAPLHAVAAPLAGFRRHGGQKTALAFDAYLAEAEAVLRRDGTRPYGRAESAFRRAVWTCFGGRPLVRMPRRAAAALTATGVLRPAPVLAWKSGWRTTVDYVV
ncbi:MAG: glycosyltransferase family 2 protein [Vicinamibacteria bacterium]